MTQTEAVLTALRERGEKGLTPIEALDEIGSFRLAARIADCRHLLAEYERIDSERVTLRNGKSVARYVLRKKKSGVGQMALRL